MHTIVKNALLSEKAVQYTKTYHQGGRPRSTLVLHPYAQDKLTAVRVLRQGCILTVSIREGRARGTGCLQPSINSFFCKIYPFPQKKLVTPSGMRINANETKFLNDSSKTRPRDVI